MLPNSQFPQKVGKVKDAVEGHVGGRCYCIDQLDPGVESAST